MRGKPPPRFPDFVVVGAPRCGTTSLCRYLARNPQVCFSQPKEPHYFARLDHEPSHAELQRDYLDRYFDLAAEPLAVYRRVLEFLHVDYDGRTRFEPKYESRTYRYRWLQRLLYVPAIRGGKVVDTLQRRARKRNKNGPRRKSLIKRLTHWNTVSARPAPLTSRMEAIVRERLMPDVEHLSNLLDRDLTRWLGGVRS